ncbi:MAG: glutathione transferase GstA [Methylococcales bacterium]
MKLYYSPGACSLSPHICLCEAELDYELIQVDLQQKTMEKQQDFTAINPFGYVPALELDNGEILLEGPAIVQYIGDLVPDKNLLPANGHFERYRLQQWLNFISTELHKGIGSLFNPTLPENSPAFFINNVSRRFDVLVSELESKTYLMGEQFTVADAYLFTVLSWCPLVQFDLSKWPVLMDYQKSIAARPAVQRAMKEEGLNG